MFAGNLGAVIAGAPLAWIVTQTSWRAVFLGLAALSIALGIASWCKVRDRPEQMGFRAGARAAARRGRRRMHWTQALCGACSRIRRRGRDSSSTPASPAAISPSPASGRCRIWSRPTACRASPPRSTRALLLLGVAFGAVLVGIVSDRLGSRRGVMRVYALLYALSWLPWVLHAQWPLPATLAWFALMGLLIPGFTLTWAVAKEVNRPEHSGIATVVVNVGIFLGTGILQPLVGAVLDRGRAAGDLAGAWDRGILLMAGAAAFGALMTLLVRERPRRPDRRRFRADAS